MSLMVLEIERVVENSLGKGYGSVVKQTTE
jgi:hypothetical protein